MVQRVGAGLAFMAFSSLSLTLNDAVTKLLLGRFGAGQIVATQAGIVLLVVCLVGLMRGARPPRGAELRWQMVRALLNAASMVTFVWGLHYLPLTQSVLVSFTNPLLTALLAPVLLGERTNPLRIGSALLGFAGIAIGASGGEIGMSPYLLLPLASAVFATLRDLVTRRNSRDSSLGATMLCSTAVNLIVGLVWTQGIVILPGGSDIWLFAFLCGCFGLALFAMVESLRLADAGLVSPAKYTSAIWAIIIDYLFWSLVPSPQALVGAVVVIAAMLGLWLSTFTWRQIEERRN